jgi:hypothetical protein
MDQILKNQFHYTLDIPINFEPVFLEADENQHVKYDIDLVTSDLKNWLYSLGLKIVYGEQFLLTNTIGAMSTWPLHIDDPHIFVKLNYVYSDTDADMEWYELKPGHNLLSSITSVGTNYTWAKKDSCNLIYSAKVQKPSLVNVSILHSVAEVSSPRYCFSFVMVKLDGSHISWEEAEMIFKDYITGN